MRRADEGDARRGDGRRDIGHEWGATASATAVAAIDSARMAYAAVRTCVRGRRSPNVEAAGATMIDGMNTTPATMPASAGPPLE